MSLPHDKSPLASPISVSLPYPMGSPLHYWLYHLRQQNLNPRQLLLTAVSSGDLPSPLLHTFASDSIEYSTETAGYLEGWLPSEAIETITIKRKWIQGELPLKALEDAKKTLEQMPEFASSNDSFRLMQMLAWNLSPSGTIAARHATHFSIRPDERDWQYNHLIHLIEQRIELYQRLIYILCKRKEHLNPALSSWRFIYEESLFCD